MKYRSFLLLGLLGAAGLTSACFDGDDDDDGLADAGPASDAGKSPDATVTGSTPTPEGGSVGDGGSVTDGGQVTDASKYVPPASDGGIPARCNGAISSANNPANPPPMERPSLGVQDGFELLSAAVVSDGPRQMVALPNGDLLVGTNGNNVDIITNADGAPGTSASAPMVFATFDDAPAQGVAFDPTTCTIYVGTQHSIYAMPYVDAQLTGTPGLPIASIRTVPPDAGHDDDIHTTTSLAVVPGGHLYAAVGSDCDACTEVDPTRATIQEMNLDGTGLTTRATRVRDAIALTVNPVTGTVWAGGAGQNGLPLGHPYEWFDAITAHSGVPDYGWPDCEENQIAYVNGANCSGETVPLVETMAYQTLIGAAFYPDDSLSNFRAYDFGATYRGGLFLAGHGSGRLTDSSGKPDDAGTYHTPPLVMFIPMNGDTPVTPVNWADPTAQYTQFVYGYQNTIDELTRYGTPTGIVIGPKGTLFLAEDYKNLICLMRPH